MTTKKSFSIISIACFISILFIPIGIVLMFFYTDWKKKIKISLAAILSVVYILLAVFLLNLSPSQNAGGLQLPVPVSKDFSDVEVSSHSNYEALDLPENNSKSKSGKSNKNSNEDNEKLPKSVTKQKGRFFQSRYFYTLLFILFMMFLIIHQNIKNSKKKTYENPYVDTSKYKLPLNVGSELPMVHFQKIRLQPKEIIYFATETTKKEDEGDFIVTNKRVVVLSKNGDYEFPLNALTAISSVSNNVMLLTCGERKYYIFFPEEQIKYALAVTRWAYSKQE